MRPLPAKPSSKIESCGGQPAHLAPHRRAVGLVGQALQRLLGAQPQRLVAERDEIVDRALVEVEILVERAQASSDALGLARAPAAFARLRPRRASRAPGDPAAPGSRGPSGRRPRAPPRADPRAPGAPAPARRRAARRCAAAPRAAASSRSFCCSARALGLAARGSPPPASARRARPCAGARAPTRAPLDRARALRDVVARGDRRRRAAPPRARACARAGRRTAPGAAARRSRRAARPRAASRAAPTTLTSEIGGSRSIASRIARVEALARAAAAPGLPTPT